ncbi:hypothetical protein CRG98_031218 [Punica granatum]|uniref:Uncharacterized protein n=1 Tax=Punica granatum TaxID=22663 RepID=A0A2I0IWL8_PUNGR|nr:hypothetical protein CRG98_031218 [Punica granatum]
MAPLTDCMKGGRFEWTEGAKATFQKIKEHLTTASILVLLDFQQPFELHSDILKVGIGAVLSQNSRPIAFFSEKLTGAKVRYNTYDVEFYAVVQADKVSTHHASWVAYLERFTFVVKHKSGVTNHVADALSWRRSVLSRMTVEKWRSTCNAERFVKCPRVLPLTRGCTCPCRFPRNHGWISVWISSSACPAPSKGHPFPEPFLAEPLKDSEHSAKLQYGLSPTDRWAEKEIHETMQNNLEKATMKYKNVANRRRKHVEFEVSNFVWVVLTKDRFSTGDYHKFAARKIGTMEVVEKINPNAYRLKLSSHIHTTDVFNVKYLIPYTGDSLDDDDSRANSLHLRENDVA